MYCPKCNRKRRTGERRKDLRDRIIWVVYCLLCNTEITLEDSDGVKPDEVD